MARLSYAELRPDVVDKLNSLRRANPKTGKQMSYARSAQSSPRRAISTSVGAYRVGLGGCDRILMRTHLGLLFPWIRAPIYHIVVQANPFHFG